MGLPVALQAVRQFLEVRLVYLLSPSHAGRIWRLQHLTGHFARFKALGRSSTGA